MPSYFEIKRKRRISTIVVPLFFAALTLYFCYHALSGERGMLALIKLRQQVEKQSAELDNTRAERLQIEHKVTLMRPDSLDLDLVDEQARRSLGYAGKNEAILFRDQK
jgi:cell division protein FtsB